MFIKTNKYGTLQAACGIQLYFNTVLPVPQKIGTITNLSRSNGVSSATLSDLPDSLNSGDKISISNLSIVPAFTIVPVPDSYIGSFTINSVNRSSKIITFNQNLANDNIGSVNGEIYKQTNISPAEKYIIEYSVETKVPSTANVILRPSTIVESGDRSFDPTTVVEISSTYSLSSKVLIKMIIRDFKSNQILKTEYQEIIVADSESKPCEIIYEKPITISFYELNKKNNWSYFYEGYLLAQFIPNTEYKDITIKLIKKNNILLPSRGGKNRIRIVVNPLAIQEKQTNIDKIREAIVSQYDIINNAYAVVNLGNRSYDIIVEDVLLKPEDFKGIIVDVVPPVTGTPIKFEDVAKAIPYSQDIYSIPKISLLRWNNNNAIRFIGELHYNEKIYDNDPMILNISGSINLSGTIRDVTNGINYIS
jgi:hypothetical protein